jgi:hypothetical protein
LSILSGSLKKIGLPVQQAASEGGCGWRSPGRVRLGIKVFI